MTIGKRVIFGFAATIAITALLGGYLYTSLSAIDSASKVVVGDALPGAYFSGQINSLAAEGFLDVYQHATSTTQQQKDAAEAAIARRTASIEEMFKKYEASITTEEDRQLFRQVIAVRDGFRSVRDGALALSREGKGAEALEKIARDVQPAYQKYSDACTALADLNRQIGDRSGTAITGAISSGRTGAVIGMVSGVAAGALLAFFIIRGVNKALTRVASALGEGSEQVASAAQQVSASSQSLAQGASEQAASLEETSSSLEEMSSMTKKNAETAQQARTLSEEARHAAEKGNDAMGKMNTAIDDIHKSAGETAKIIKVIDEIAFQTNLLALNAAVEAARAGEAGKGFAVVAEEVRNLAMRSAEAAKNTSSLIEGSVNNAKNGVAIASEVGKVLEEITGAAQKVNSLVGEIAAASEEQSRGIDQVNTAVGQMDKVTQSNAANAEESASASEELSSQAEQMNHLVSELVSLVAGTQHARTAARAPSTARRAPTAAASPKPSKKSAPCDVLPLDSSESHDFSDFKQAA